MRQRVWVALIDWIDGPVEDTDEFRVRACSAKDAERIALDRWIEQTGRKYPHCKIASIACVPPHDVGVF